MYSTTQNQKANLDSIFNARTRGGLRLPGRIETLFLELAKWIWSDEEIAPHRSDKYSADAVAKHDARVAGTQDRLVALLAAALSIVLPGARLLCANYRPGRWAKVAGLEQRVCLGCDRPQAEHADAPDAAAQSTTAGVVAELREERPEPRTAREPILPPPPAAPEEEMRRREAIRRIVTRLLTPSSPCAERWLSTGMIVKAVRAEVVTVDFEEVWAAFEPCELRSRRLYEPDSPAGEIEWALEATFRAQERAGRPTPKAEAEARIWELYAKPGAAADKALVELARRLGRLPNKDDTRALLAHMRATCSELAERAGDIDAVKGGAA